MLYMVALMQTTDSSLLHLNYLDLPVAKLEPTSSPLEGERKMCELELQYIKITGLVDKGRPMDAIYLDFSTGFNTISHNILLSK